MTWITVHTILPRTDANPDDRPGAPQFVNTALVAYITSRGLDGCHTTAIWHGSSPRTESGWFEPFEEVMTMIRGHWPYDADG